MQAEADDAGVLTVETRHAAFDPVGIVPDQVPGHPRPFQSLIQGFDPIDRRNEADADAGCLRGGFSGLQREMPSFLLIFEKPERATFPEIAVTVGIERRLDPPDPLTRGVLGHLPNQAHQIFTRSNHVAGCPVHFEKPAEIVEFLVLCIRRTLDAVACAKLAQRRFAHGPFEVEMQMRFRQGAKITLGYGFHRQSDPA